jgi:hypothetical protein
MAEKNSIPVYKIRIDDSDMSATGVHCVSNVLYPAIESNFVALSKELPKLDAEEILSVNKQRLAKLSLGESKPMKGLMTGPLLIPDFQIFRMDADGKPYFIEFSSEVIEQIRDKYSRQGWHRNNNDDHYQPLGATTIVELWIVEDPEKDKAAALGLTVPKGTLMATMKVEDHEYFEREILSGNRRGFSIEGWFEYDGPVEMSAQVQAKAEPQKRKSQKLNMKPSKKKGGIMSALASLFGALTATGSESLATHVMEDGTNLIVVDETQQAFYLTDENKLGDALPDGEYLLADGNTLVILEGMVVEIREGEVEDVTEEEVVVAADDPATETVTAEVATLATGLGIDPAKLLAAVKKANLSIVDFSKFTLSAKHQLSAEEKLSVMVDANGLVLYVDQTDGSIWKVGEDLWYEGPAAVGEYALADGTTLTVFERTESYEGWDGTTISVTKSYVNYPASTVAVETLVPWLKETMSAVQKATEQLTAQKAEIVALKAKNAKLATEPAAAAPVKAPATPQAPVNAGALSKKEIREQRAARAVESLHAAGH